MGEAKGALQIEEEEAFEREQGLVEMEAQLHHQEQGVIEMERSFKQRASALINLASFVSEQQGSLLTRAETIGPKAKRLVEEMLHEQNHDDVLQDLDFGVEERRSMLLERRLELVDIRTELLDEREAMFAERHEMLDSAEARIVAAEEALMAQEMELAQILRKLITSASDLSGPDDGMDLGTGGHSAPTERVRESNAIGREPLKVTSGEVQARDGAGRQRRGARVNAKTSQVRFNLEAQMGSDEGHHFFQYSDDGPDDLPGLFVATRNLLKEDREVRVAIGLDGKPLQAKGVVAWRRKPGDAAGTPGMGIELTWVADEARDALNDWIASHPPTVA